MYRYKQEIHESNRVTQTKPAAWAVKRSSAYKLNPFTSRGLTGSLKPESSKVAQRKSNSKGSAANSKSKLKRLSGKSDPLQLGGGKEDALTEDFESFKSRLKALEPSIKSLSTTVPTLSNKNKSQNKQKGSNPVTKTTLRKEIDEEDISQGLARSNLEGEKLITVGGYIISLQSNFLEHITTLVKPRVSSNKDGFELEIKVTGCHPSEIKFEKRYNTLIIIGVLTGPPRHYDDNPIQASTTDEKRHNITMSKTVKASNFMTLSRKNDPVIPLDTHDDITEIINIFVPKNIPLTQIYISRPDAKGRIFVKGP